MSLKAQVCYSRKKCKEVDVQGDKDDKDNEDDYVHVDVVATFLMSRH